MAVQKRPRMPFPGERTAKRRRTGSVRGPLQADAARGAGQGAAAAPDTFLVQWDPSKVLPPKVKPPVPSTSDGNRMEVEGPGTAASPFAFNASCSMTPAFSFFTLGAVPSGRGGARARCGGRGHCPGACGPTAPIRSPTGGWRATGARRTRRVSPARVSREATPDLESAARDLPEDEDTDANATANARQPATLSSVPTPHSPPVAAASATAPAATAHKMAPSEEMNSETPCDRVIALLCELIKDINLTSACIPLTKRRTLDHAMLLKRINALCTELEHQFDTINTLRNLADEATTREEERWLLRQRERVDQECQAIEQEINDIKAVLAAGA